MSKNNNRRPVKARGKANTTPRRVVSNPTPRRAVKRATSYNNNYGHTIRTGISTLVPASAIDSYINAMCHPVTAPPCGIPKFPVVPSLKYKNFERFTFATGTDSHGWIAVRPVAARGMASVRTITNGSSTGAAWTNGVSVTSAGFPYQTGDIGANAIHTRIVHMYLRVRNITPALSRGGTCELITMPDGRDLPGSGLTQGDMSSFQPTGYWSQGRTDGGWCGVHYYKSDPKDYDYNADPYPSYTERCVGAYAVGSAQSYEAELYTFVEYITDGIATIPGSTHTDPHPAAETVDAHHKVAASSSGSADIPSTASRLIKTNAKHNGSGQGMLNTLRTVVEDAKSVWSTVKAGAAEVATFAAAA